MKAPEAKDDIPEADPSSKGWKIGVAAALLAAALGYGFYRGVKLREREAAALAENAKADVEAPVPVAAVRVGRAGNNKLMSLPGEARAFNETTLYARTSGYVKEWKVDIGDVVKQGQTLATIETPELDDQLVAARAKVDQAQANAKLAETGVTFAKLTYDRWQEAAPEGVVSEQERDAKKAELDNATAKAAAAKAEIELAKAEVRRLETLSSFKNVTAPFDGTITKRDIDIGDLVTAGSTTSTSPLFSVERSDKLRVFVDLPQAASHEVSVGGTASIFASEFPERAFTGTVDRSAGALDRASRTMRVELLVENPKFELKPGDYVQVRFSTKRSTAPVEIPSAALTYRNGSPTVAVVTENSTLTFRPITIGQDLGDRIELAAGLDVGDRVALNVSSDAAEGEKVLVHEDAPKTASAK